MLRLKRDVGLFGATMYILGVIIGAGIYVILGSAAGIAGPALWISFFAAAVIAACTGFSYAELASTFPYDGAEYVYTERAFRDRRFSFGIGWLKIATHCIAMAAVALGFGGYLALLTGWNFILCALLLLAVITLINLMGLKAAVEFDIAMVLIAIIGLLAVIGFGASSIKAPDFYWTMPNGISGMFTAAALVFFAFLGFENVGNISEEVRNPRRTLPTALIISVVLSTVLYVLVAVVAVSVIPWQTLGTSASPLSDVMTALMGSKAGFVMAIMALAATGSTVLGLFIGTSRMLYGLAEERTLPAFLMKVTKKRRVPYVTVLITAIVCSFFVIPGDIKSIAFLTDFGALFIFMAVNLGLIVLRYTESEIPRGFRVPLNIGRFPVVPAIGFLSCLALMIHFEKILFVAGIGLFLLGMLVYHFVSKRIPLSPALKAEIEEVRNRKRELTAGQPIMAVEPAAKSAGKTTAKSGKKPKSAKKTIAKSGKRSITKSAKKIESRSKLLSPAKPVQKNRSNPVMRMKIGKGSNDTERTRLNPPVKNKTSKPESARRRKR